jgi:hypothetical protein
VADSGLPVRTGSARLSDLRGKVVLIGREGRIAYYQSGHEPEKLRVAVRALGVR